MLQLVRDARKKGLTVPVLFMGYYNPILSYGEERLLKDCKEAGINGFIIVDLPPEEAVTFRNFCAKAGSVLVQTNQITATNSAIDSHTFP